MISQRDSSISSLKINNTDYTIGTDGCFIICVCEVAGISVQEGLKKLQFDGALLVWESIKNIGLEPLEKVNPYDNEKVKKYIADNGQCIVRVDFDGNPKSNDTHFVIYKGGGKLLDPWTGTERSTGVYPPTGIRACRKINMAGELDACLKDRQKFWDERDSLLRELQADTVEGGLNTVRGLRSRITDLTNQLGTAQAEQKNKEELLSRSTARVLQLEDDIKLLDDKLDLSNNTVVELGKDKGLLSIENEQLKIQIETLKQGQQQGNYTITIADLFKLIWNQKITIERK